MHPAIGGVDYALVGVYLAGMLALGAIVSTRIRGFRDYFLAGGVLTTPLLVCTLVSTYYELDVTFATSESGFHYGLAAWFWLSRPYYVVIIIAALVLSVRLRREPGGMTLPDVLDRHYGRPARYIGALACLVYSLPITALAGMNLLFVTLGAPPAGAIIVSAGVCAGYTMMGGLWADAVTDTVQFVLMCVSVAVAIPFALAWVGGWSFVERLPEGHMTATGGMSPWLIAAWTAGALTVFVEPAFYQRVFAAKDSASVRRALLVGILLWAAYDWGVTLLGMIGRAAVDQGLLAAGVEGKHALLEVCLNTLPVGLKGLMLGGVLAAAMSSVDSYCLLAAGNIVYDIYRPWRAGRGLPPLSDRAMIRMTRGGVLVVMLAGVGASLLFERITHAWVFMSGALVSVVFVPTAAALLGRPRRAAGVWSSACGLAALVAFHAIVRTLGVYDEDAESYVLRLGASADGTGGFQVWREYAAVAALPASALGLLVGHALGRPREEPGP